MVKVKTSVYVDRDLWSSFKEYASKSGFEVSRMLEELIKNALIEKELDKAVAEIRDSYEIDFDPVEARGEPVSRLVRVMRDERANSLFR
ncbi:CopG family transcriptional regulator [Candidatus Bathyarchaeota archaeon]|nr:CopG family transcriptional regulator [Candidatus Bathyarchaeota archaeon]